LGFFNRDQKLSARTASKMPFFTFCMGDYDVKLVMGDANAKVGRETVHQPTIWQMEIKNTYFMHKQIHLQAWQSPDGHTFNQIDHCLTDGRHFSDVIDVMARRGATIDSDHMLVVMKLRARICCASNTKPQQLRRFAVDRLKDMDGTTTSSS
jgi:hypothetical protein